MPPFVFESGFEAGAVELAQQLLNRLTAPASQCGERVSLKLQPVFPTVAIARGAAEAYNLWARPVMALE